MRDRMPVQSLAALTGVVYLLVGILGFVPGFTTHYGSMSFAGHGSGAKLLGIFQVSILHNIVHLAVGGVGLALAKTADGARRFLVGGLPSTWCWGWWVWSVLPNRFQRTWPTIGCTSPSASR